MEPTAYACQASTLPTVTTSAQENTVQKRMLTNMLLSMLGFDPGYVVSHCRLFDLSVFEYRHYGFVRMYAECTKHQRYCKQLTGQTGLCFLLCHRCVQKKKIPYVKSPPSSLYGGAQLVWECQWVKRCTCEGRGTTLGVGSCLSASSRQCLLFMTVFTRLAGLQASDDSSISAPPSFQQRGPCYSVSLDMNAGDPSSDPHTF